VSRGDRNRNARLARLRGLVPVRNAIVGIDLADAKQMVVVCDHDSRGQKPSLRIQRRLFGALTDPAGVTAHRAGALERVQLLLEDWTLTHQRIAETETRMTGVLDELGLTRLVTSITGLSAVGAAAILAQTGDPRRFATARALVKHSGLAPREKLSGAFIGRTKLTGQGRPGLGLLHRVDPGGGCRA
jgi:transposase